MIIEQHALWGDEPTPERPATYTAYLANEVGEGSRKGRPAAIICGGGSFKAISAHEQEPVALEFVNRGYQAFTLDYVTTETGDIAFPAPEADLACMVATVRANVVTWGVDPGRVVVVGFSAGGFICASLAATWRDGAFASIVGVLPEMVRPDAVMLGYPLIDLAAWRAWKTRDPRIDLRVPKTGGKTGRDLVNDFFAQLAGGEADDARLDEIGPAEHVDRHMPPTFVWCAADDHAVPVAQTYAFAAKLAEAGVTHELHVFNEGGHGPSVADANTRPADIADEAEFTARQQAVRPWVDLAFRFLDRVLA